MTFKNLKLTMRMVMKFLCFCNNLLSKYSTVDLNNLKVHFQDTRMLSHNQLEHQSEHQLKQQFLRIWEIVFVLKSSTADSILNLPVATNIATGTT